MRASIVVDVKLGELSDLKEMAAKGTLSFTDKERLNQVESLLRRLNDIKVVDAPVLLKLYNLYRYQLEWLSKYLNKWALLAICCLQSKNPVFQWPLKLTTWKRWKKRRPHERQRRSFSVSCQLSWHLQVALLRCKKTLISTIACLKRSRWKTK